MEPFAPRTVDSMFETERQAAIAAGHTTSLVNFEELVATGRPFATTRRPPEPDHADAPALYRGWMLPPEIYTTLHSAVARQGYQLLTTPEAYALAHHLPRNEPLIRTHTPRTRWLPHDQITREQVVALAASFGDTPLIVKDYVKSLKHYWAEACLIPDASDADAVWRVVSRFMELRDPVEGGLVLREYVALEQIGVHPRSHMPLSREYRVFVYHGEPVCVSPYWDAAHTEGDETAALAPPLHDETFITLMRAIPSPLFTMDLARTATGDWIIMELGDGQVAGLPDALAPEAFFGALHDTHHDADHG